MTRASEGRIFVPTTDAVSFLLGNKNLHFLSFRSHCRNKISDLTPVSSSPNLNLNFPFKLIKLCFYHTY